MPFRWVGRHQGGQDVAAHRPKAFRQYLRPLPPGTPEALHPPHQCLAQQQSLKHPRRPDPPPPPEPPLRLWRHHRPHRFPLSRQALPARLQPVGGTLRQMPHPPPTRALAAADLRGQLLVRGTPTEVFLGHQVPQGSRVPRPPHQAVWRHGRHRAALPAVVAPQQELDLVLLAHIPRPGRRCPWWNRLQPHGDHAAPRVMHARVHGATLGTGLQPEPPQ